MPDQPHSSLDGLPNEMDMNWPDSHWVPEQTRGPHSCHHIPKVCDLKALCQMLIYDLAEIESYKDMI